VENQLVKSVYGEICDADNNFDPAAIRTPLYRSYGLSKVLSCDVWLKCEHLQTTGSFKYRGASNKIPLLSETEKNRGVVTASTGNHGQAFALSGLRAGVSVTVYEAAKTSSAKIASMKEFGANLKMVDGS